MIGSLSVAEPGIIGALAAGLFSFLSPCVLPLVPVYLSFVSGESASDIKRGQARRGRVLTRTLLFALGFTLVFTTLGLAFGGGMRFIGSSARHVVNQVAGIIVIALALNYLFDFIPALRREARVQTSRAPARDPSDSGGRAILSGIRSVLTGMAFAAGWTPCVGPILSSILLLSGESGDPARAAILLGAYSAGLAIPFILAGAFLDRAFDLFGFFKRHNAAVRIVTGSLLLVFGILLLAGNLSLVTAFFLRQGYALEGLSQTGPAWIRPLAAAIARWLLFQGA
jgi:cytochrome c-type biogenesis protein